MKKKTSFIIIIIFISFCFIVLFKGLNKSNIYVPSATSGKQLLSFDAKKLFNNDIKESISYKQSYVFVTGFVLRPTGHKYISGYTVNDYISMSGGMTDFGSINNIPVPTMYDITQPNLSGSIVPEIEIIFKINQCGNL